MKFLVSFMGLLVLALSCIPCADEELSYKEELGVCKEISISGQKEKQEDACAPFCNCNCCLRFSDNHSISISLIPATESRISRNPFYNSVVAKLSIPVWQPPQLS